MTNETHECSKCGENLSLDNYHKKRNGKRAYSWCKKCHGIRQYEFRRTPLGKYTELRNDAKKRGIDFTITFEEALSIWNNPCSYCGREISLLSLDRIDDSKPYTKDNIAVCCRWCNYTKGTGSLSFFYNQCKLVVENMPLNFRSIGDKNDGGERYKDSYHSIGKKHQKLV